MIEANVIWVKVMASPVAAGLGRVNEVSHDGTRWLEIVQNAF